MEHLSDLALDGLVHSGERPAHLADCAACARRLDAFAAASAQLRLDSRFALERAKLTQAPPPVRAVWARWQTFGAMSALAASVLLVWTLAPRHPIEETRLKGGVGLEVALESGAAPEAFRAGDTFFAGETVSLRLSAAGHPYALVLGMDDAGQVVQLWPLHAGASGPAPRGAGARVTPSFRVTPGDLQLWGFYSDEPLSAADASEAMREAVAHGPRSALDAVPAPLPGEAARAPVRLHVLAPVAP